MMAIVTAPWTEEQVAALNAWQAGTHYHPFTCGGARMDEAHVAYQRKHGGDYGQLVAGPDGWRCPVCGYRQNWAHGHMAERQAP